MDSWYQVEVPTRAYVLVEAPPPPRRARVALWAFHGYAEHPRTALDALRGCRTPDTLLVAPMGQHHLYDRSGEVVASWMTRHQRDDQVRQIVGFLEAAYAELSRAYGALPLLGAGFSQGGATAYRLAALTRVPLRGLHIFAGAMPPEVAAGLAGRPPVPVTLHWGRGDRQVPRGVLEADRARLRQAGWPARLQVHSGGHHWLGAGIQSVREDLVNIVHGQD